MKSTQEQSEELYNIFNQVEQVDEQIYYSIIEMLRKENISDCIGFLSKLDNQKQLYEQLNIQKEINFGTSYIYKTTNIIKKIQDHDFNKQNYCEEIYIDLKQNLINKISQDKKIIQLLKFLILLTAFDQTQIQCGSNSLHFLVEMKVVMRNTNFENIKLKIYLQLEIILQDVIQVDPNLKIQTLLEQIQMESIFLFYLILIIENLLDI